ncbi:peptidoglycan DD-metalloendopeptidase family protein [Microbacterium sp. A93]|uniref:M23 family metallopeptidase n=1 Tax=Microbacterium sp. A93 TaxID=3450716 RepID=UPI003F423899
MRVSYACVAAAAIVIAATGAGTLIDAPDENLPEAAASLVVHDELDHIEAPESHTAGFSDVATRFAERALVQATARTASVYSATTTKELAEKGRAAREALIRSAIESGLEVDLSRFKDDDVLSSVGEFIWPVANARISDNFGTRGGQHAGMDLAAAGGTPITAASPGIVVLSSESHYGYGVAVIIQHINGVQTLYGHMTYGSRVVEEGDWVEAGDPIGLVGSTGHSFGDHLHFEVRVKGVAVDPRGYLDGAGDPVKVAPWTPKPGGTPAQVPVAPEPATAPKPVPMPSGTPTPSPTGTPTPSPTGTPTPAPTPTDPPGTPTPTPTPTPDPTPTDPPTTPEPTDPPVSPEPTDPPVSPEPTEPPVSPEPTDPPTTPEPTDPPASPEPTEPPASPEQPAAPEPTQEPTAPANTPEPSPSAAPE